MEVRFKNKSDVFNILVTILAAAVSIATMIYGVVHLGFENTWPELVLNVFYIACVVMMLMYFFKWGITTKQFNYWCTLNVGITVLLRDILFAPPLVNYPLHLTCLTLSVALILRSLEIVTSCIGASSKPKPEASLPIVKVPAGIETILGRTCPKEGRTTNKAAIRVKILFSIVVARRVRRH